MKKLFVFLFIVAYTKMNAQFIIAGQYTASDYFHDVVPDSVFRLNVGGIFTKQIDLNGDGIIDFDLVVLKGGGQGNPGGEVYVTPKNNNQIVSAGYSVCSWTASGSPPSGTASSTITTAFQLGDTIKNNLNWVSTPIDIAYRYWCTVTNFNISTSKFLGVRIFVGSDTLYGWIKLKVYDGYGFSYSGFILEEFACNKGTSIGIKEYVSNPPLKIYPNPTSDKIEVFFDSAPSDIKIKLLNSLGQIILEDKKTNSNKFTLDVSRYPNGVYYVEMENSKVVSRTKFVKN